MTAASSAACSTEPGFGGGGNRMDRSTWSLPIAVRSKASTEPDNPIANIRQMGPIRLFIVFLRIQAGIMFSPISTAYNQLRIHRYAKGSRLKGNGLALFFRTLLEKPT